MRIGLLGYGVIAAEHAEALSRSGCALVAVAGPTYASAAQFADLHGVGRATDDVSQVIAAEDVDAIVVASPNEVHTEQTLASLAAGKAVLCEVPLAMSAEDALSVARQSGSGRVMVCHTQRFLEPIQRIREWGATTAIRHIIIRLVLRRTDNVGVTGRQRSWVDDVVWHHGSHLVDTALWLLDDDEVTDVAAIGTGRSERGSPMDVGIALRARSGALVTLALSYRAQAAATDFMIICDGGTYRYEHGVLSASDGSCDEYDEAGEFTRALRRQDEHFVSQVGGALSPTPAELSGVYRTLALINSEIDRRREWDDPD